MNDVVRCACCGKKLVDYEHKKVDRLRCKNGEIVCKYCYDKYEDDEVMKIGDLIDIDIPEEIKG